MEQTVQDLRYAVRSFFRHPSFAVTAILTLALGIGATTAIFSVVNSVVFRPLPFEDPGRIVAITNLSARTGNPSVNVSAPDFHDWREQSRSFAAMGYYYGSESSVTLGDRADYAMVLHVSPGFFDALGARAARGRLLTAEELRPGGPLGAVITDAFWKRQFNGDPGAIGGTIKYDDQTFTIVGVLEPRQRFPGRADVYCPAWLNPETTSRSGHNYRVVARLGDGVTVEQAHAEMTAIARRLEAQYPDSNSGKLARVVPLKDQLVGANRTMFDVLLGAVVLVLLIACANVGNLLLSRSSVRTREMVVRAAVGASRKRLVQQLLTESVVLGVAAGLCGMWLARLGVRALVALAPADLPRVDEVSVDAVALLFALLVALIASFLFGLAPALQISRVHLAGGLREGGKGTSIGARGGWARSAFVVAEVALAMVLVAGAGLLARSLAALSAVDMGFETDRLLVVRTAVPIRTLEEAPRATAFYRDLLADLRAVPGVESIGGVTSLPTVVRSNGRYAIEGVAAMAPSSPAAPQAVLNVVTPGYFPTLGVALRRGRDFTDSDRRGAPMVAIVNEALARQSFPGGDPIGRRIQCGLDSLEFMTIVGVVADVRTWGPASSLQPEIYMPYEQHPGPATALNLVVRTHPADPLAVVETIRRKIATRNPDVPIKAETMEGTLETASATPRFRTFLLGVFAAVALLLALAGVYGVMAYSVSQRVPELGVRIALGATPGTIMRMVLIDGGKLAAAGLAIGLALALAAGRVLQGLLFGVTPRDPMILAAMTLVVAVATFAACYIPARRAVSVDPVEALRVQ